MSCKKILIGVFFIGIFLLLGINPAFAGVLCDPCDGATPCNPGLDCIDGVCQKPSIITFCPSTKTNSLAVFIKSIINFVFYIALAVVPLLLIIGGVMLVKSGGNPEQVKKAKELIFWSVVGFVVLLLAQAIKAAIEFLALGNIFPSLFFS